MKLYTEIEVRKAIKADNWTHSETQILETLTPIEIPSDRDIEIAANGNQEHYEGAMWLKYKYLTKTNNL